MLDELITVVEYQKNITPASSSGACDGILTITAWLHVTGRRQLDTRTTWNIDRKALPQTVIIKFKCNLGGFLGADYSECCSEEKKYPNPRQEQIDKHNFSCEDMESRFTNAGGACSGNVAFKWKSNLLGLTAEGELSGGLSIPVLPDPGGAVKGKGSVDVQGKSYSVTVNWDLPEADAGACFDPVVHEPDNGRLGTPPENGLENNDRFEKVEMGDVNKQANPLKEKR